MPAHPLTGVLEDARQATRCLRRRMASSLSIVCVMALAIAVNSTVFSAVSAVLLGASPYPAPDRLVRLWFGDQESQGGRALPRDLARWTEAGEAFEHVGAYRPGVQTFATELESGRAVAVAEVSASLFDVLGIHPTRGRPFIREDETAASGPVVILRQGLWDEAPGEGPGRDRYVLIDGVRHRVVGTVGPTFEFPDRQTMAWIPLPPPVAPRQVTGQSVTAVQSVFGIARLKPGVTLERARIEAHAIFDSRDRRSMPQVALMREVDVRSVRRALIILQLAVGLVLLTACANVAHLLLARSLERRPEFAVRTALGASRYRLIRQWVIEGLMLSAAGGVLGLCLAAWGIAWLNAAAPPTLLRGASIRLDAGVLAFSLAATAAAALLTITAPGLQTLRLKPEHLDLYRKSAGTGSPVRSSGRGLLIAGQFAVALALLVTTTVLIKSFINLVAVDSGFDAAGVATARLRLPDTHYARLETRTRLLSSLLDSWSRTPTLKTIALAGYFPLDEQESIDFTLPGSGRLIGRRQAVSEGYFSTLGIPIVRGRGFTDADGPGAPGVVVVSRAFAAKYLDTADPLTSSIVRSGRTWNVIGVAEDVRGGGLTAPPWPVVYFTFRQLAYERVAEATALRRVILFARSDGDALSELRSLGPTLQAIDSTLALDDIAPLADRLNRSIVAPRFYASMMLVFSGLALVLAAVGVSGLVSYAVARQVPDIALRMALGASRQHVYREIGRLVVVPMVLGIAAGVTASFWLSWGFRDLLFEVAPFDPASLAASIVILLGCGLAACAPSARRAVSIDPAAVLRHY